MTLFRRCIHSPTPVVHLNDVVYFASSRNDIMEFDGDFVINLSGIPNVNISDEFSELAKFIEYPFQEIMIPWPNFKMPKVKMEIWGELHEFIERKGWKEVCIHCDGGHGRTGTAISALIIANAGLTAQDAVEIVREEYCNMAVETMEQCLYLQGVDLWYNNNEMEEETCPTPSMFMYPKENES